MFRTVRWMTFAVLRALWRPLRGLFWLFDKVTGEHRRDLETTARRRAMASSGDPQAATDRLKLLAGVPLVPITDEVRQIADALITASLMPTKAGADALHVAAAAFAGVEYLSTQNCRHIANAHTLPGEYAVLADRGYGGLLICTPAEFLGELYDDKESNP